MWGIGPAASDALWLTSVSSQTSTSYDSFVCTTISTFAVQAGEGHHHPLRAEAMGKLNVAFEGIISSNRPGLHRHFNERGVGGGLAVACYVHHTAPPRLHQAAPTN